MWPSKKPHLTVIVDLREQVDQKALYTILARLHQVPSSPERMALCIPKQKLDHKQRAIALIRCLAPCLLRTHTIRFGLAYSLQSTQICQQVGPTDLF